MSQIKVAGFSIVIAVAGLAGCGVLGAQAQSSSDYAGEQSVIRIGPTVTGTWNSPLGTSVANPASNYFAKIRNMEKGCRDDKPSACTTVEAKYEGSTLKNPESLVPKSLLIIPRILGIHSEYEAQLTNAYRRVQPYLIGHSIRLPAEGTFFIYALNSEGKLINPSTPKNPTDPLSKYVPTLEFTLAGDSPPKPEADIPLVTNIDLDMISTEYDRNMPQGNPPNGFMVRSSVAGRYSLHVTARLNPAILNDTQKEGVLSKFAYDDVEIEVINGPKMIDALRVAISPKQPLIDAGKPVQLSLSVGNSLVLDLSGLSYKYKLNEANYSYVPDGYRVYQLHGLTVSYETDPVAPAQAQLDDFFDVRSLNSDGTLLCVTARKSLPSGKSIGKLVVAGYGRQFELKLRATASGDGMPLPCSKAP